MRSPLGARSNLPNQTFVTFNAGPYRTEHSDLDALGITMYSDGSTVLPESGLFTYTDQPDRGYFHGTSAHNTVVVDGQDQAPGDATPGPYGIAGGATWATATSGLYAGVDHRRSVIVLRQGVTLVLDRLSSDTGHAYTQTWHLDPAATIVTTGAETQVSNAVGKRTLTVAQADLPGLTLDAVKGQTSPTLQGFYSAAYGTKVPNWALQYSRSGTDALFATVLAAGAHAATPVTVTETGAASASVVNVCVAGTVGYRVVVPPGGAPVNVVPGACA